MDIVSIFSAQVQAYRSVFVYGLLRADSLPKRHQSMVLLISKFELALHRRFTVVSAMRTFLMVAMLPLCQ